MSGLPAVAVVRPDNPPAAHGALGLLARCGADGELVDLPRFNGSTTAPHVSHSPLRASAQTTVVPETSGIESGIEPCTHTGNVVPFARS